VSTAFVFAPLSSVLRPQDRFRYRCLEEVQARFAQAEGILKEYRGLQVHFDSLLDQPTAQLCARAHVNLTAGLIIAMQMGVVDRLGKSLAKPAWVVGCSLGDVARTVTAGVCTFDTALHVAMMSIADVEQAEPIGGNVVVMTTSRRPIDADDLAWFKDVDLAVSQLSDRLLNVAGLVRPLQLLRERAAQRHWRVSSLFDFPLHSRHVAEFAHNAKELIPLLPLQAPDSGIRVYSSVLNREMKQLQDFREEFVSWLLRPHNWMETVRDLVENHGIRQFVNIGPCRTLSRVLIEMGQDVVESDHLINGNVA